MLVILPLVSEFRCCCPDTTIFPWHYFVLSEQCHVIKYLTGWFDGNDFKPFSLLPLSRFFLVRMPILQISFEWSCELVTTVISRLVSICYLSVQIQDYSFQTQYHYFRSFHTQHYCFQTILLFPDTTLLFPDTILLFPDTTLLLPDKTPLFSYNFRRVIGYSFTLSEPVLRHQPHGTTLVWFPHTRAWCTAWLRAVLNIFSISRDCH